MKSWWHKNVRGTNGRILGIINTAGETWSHQRRFSLKQLRDLGFGKKSLDSVMVEEVDYVIEKMAEEKDVLLETTYNTGIINVLWQIVASKRFEPDAPDTKRMIGLLNKQFKSGFKFGTFLAKFKQFLPPNDIDKSFFEMKSMMRSLIKEHLNDIDYDNPRDFIDVYLKQVHDEGKHYDEEHLVVICLDFFQAGAETTR